MEAPPEIPPEVLDLDDRERAFVEGVVLEGLTWAEAGRRAGYTEGYQSRLRRRPKISAAIKALRIPDSERLILGVAEIRERLSDIARDETQRTGDRTKAMEHLLKIEGALGPETYVDARQQSVTYQVGAGTPETLLDVLDALLRLSLGETVSPEEAKAALEAYARSQVQALPAT